ncbi:lipase maturation factor 1-like isoform X2 [Dendronephthya gigantea]|uniref:lipase maturation factor 1-like isoform X2 n=1 Tax=Dendronephthya gigantea TaxID=151771 RepID=UPI00106BFB5B|nr:lipase maturation factor 1-like isoform X2 [Dendronephthya gigantea]
MSRTIHASRVDKYVFSMASNRNDNSTIRCRKNIENTHSTPGEVESVPKRTFNTSETRSDHRENSVSSGTYWLTRIVFLRSLAFVYFFAFLVALNQNKQLLGDDGLLPVPNFLNKVRNYFGGTFGLSTFQAVPSLLWAVNPANINQYLDMIAYCGALLSLFVFYTGCCNMVIMLTLWILYHSLVNVGQLWYSFGWESQLLETGFLAIFLCPILKLRQIPEQTPTSWVVIFGYRWLIFRIMFGAGMIKIRGDQCWRDLTCMNYHYQVVLIFSGNLSFLNWLTILPSIMCFDDKALAWCFPVSSHARRQVCKLQKLHLDGNSRRPSKGLRIRWIMDVFLGLLLAYLSISVVQNLFSSRQIMNTSFDSLRIVNTYGAFGSITKERTEIIIQGTRNKTSYGDNVVWEEYEFKCKPGNVRKRPCVISPYHYRLDWLMWFAAFQNYQNNPWLIHLSAKLLVNDPDATSLISHNPFKNGPPPRYIRAEHYLYEFTKFGSPEARDGKWWSRRKIATYFHPFSMKDIKDYLRNQGWKIPRI